MACGNVWLLALQVRLKILFSNTIEYNLQMIGKNRIQEFSEFTEIFAKLKLFSTSCTGVESLLLCKSCP